MLGNPGIYVGKTLAGKWLATKPLAILKALFRTPGALGDLSGGTSDDGQRAAASGVIHVAAWTTSYPLSAQGSLVGIFASSILSIASFLLRSHMRFLIGSPVSWPFVGLIVGLLLCVGLSPMSHAQNGIVFDGPLGNDLTDPGNDGSLDATISSGGNSPFGEDDLKGVDNLSSTKWLSFLPDGTFYEIQLDSASPLFGYALTSANDAEERDPYEWTLSGSNDGVSFSLLDSRTGIDFVNRFETQLYSLDSLTASYEYYRFEFLTERGAGGPNPGTPNSIQIAEIELFADDRRPLLGDIDGDRGCRPD